MVTCRLYSNANPTGEHCSPLHPLQQFPMCLQFLRAHIFLQNSEIYR